MKKNGGLNREKELVDQLRSMQVMEKETREQLSKFMSTLNDRKASEQDCATLLLEKMEELRVKDQEIDNKAAENSQLQSRINVLLEKQEQYVTSQQKNFDDQLHFQKSLADSDKVIRKLESQIQAQQRNYSLDVEQKASVIRSLEDECTAVKAENEGLHRRIESSEVEAGELHGAMSSLHGEISVLNNEINDAKEREKEIMRQRKELSHRLECKEEDIIKIRNEKNVNENKLKEMERRLLEITDKTALIEHDSATRVGSLQRERDSVQGSLGKMSLKIKMQGQTLHELNSLLNKMRPELAASNEAKELAEARAMVAEKGLSELQVLVTSLESKRIEHEALTQRQQQEARGLVADLSQLKEKNTELVAETRKMINRIDRLEKDKHDMALDVSGKARDLEVVRNQNESLQVAIEDMKARVDTERSSRERALESNGLLESEVERLRSDNREHQENADSLARQLREADRMREQALETSRSQQRENANRIVEFSQKNSKLSAELSTLHDEIASTKRLKDETIQELRECQKERDEARAQLVSARARIQTLEDQFEESSCRLESRKAELDELRSDIRREIQAKDVSLSNLKHEHEQIIFELTKKFETETEEKNKAVSKVHEMQTSALEKALAKAKEMHQQAIEELQAHKHRDVVDAKSKLATVAKAMESLQNELRDETNKNKILMQELTVLKDLAEIGSSEAQERLHYVERERLRDRARLDGQLADVKEQLRQHIEQKQQRDQLMNTIEQQLSRERDARFASMQRVRTLEDEHSSLSSQLENLTEENTNLKKAVREHERKLSLALQAKDAELHRLTRRNEVLGEAVTRLTSMQHSGNIGSSISINSNDNITLIPNGAFVGRNISSSAYTIDTDRSTITEDTFSPEVGKSQYAIENAEVFPSPPSPDYGESERFDEEEFEVLAKRASLTSKSGLRPHSGAMPSVRKSNEYSDSGPTTNRAKSAPPTRHNASSLSQKKELIDETEEENITVDPISAFCDNYNDGSNNGHSLYPSPDTTHSSSYRQRPSTFPPASLVADTSPEDYPTIQILSPTAYLSPNRNEIGSSSISKRRKNSVLSDDANQSPREGDENQHRSGSGSGGRNSVFASRVRGSVEKGKDQLLPFSPKSKRTSPIAISLSSTPSKTSDNENAVDTEIGNTDLLEEPSASSISLSLPQPAAASTITSSIVRSSTVGSVKRGVSASSSSSSSSSSVKKDNSASAATRNVSSAGGSRKSAAPPATTTTAGGAPGKWRK